MPRSRQQLLVERHYDADEYERLRQGHVPVEQDDRWFVWMGPDRVVHIHRSWSGFEIYRARLEAVGDSYDVVEAWVNVDPEQYEPIAGFDDEVLGPMLDSLAGR